MRVAVFRGLADGQRTAQRLHDLGHEAVSAPVLRIVATGAAAEPHRYAGVIFTSPQAPPRLAEDPEAPRLKTLPCWCVGGQTAKVAQACGFAEARAGVGDAQALAGLISAAPLEGPLLFATGRDRKPDLEIILATAGIVVSVVEVYRAQPTDSWSAETIEQLRTCSAALHYSLRSADLALGLAQRTELLPRFLAWRHVCLSPAIATMLVASGVADVAAAAKPVETMLLACLTGP